MDGGGGPGGTGGLGLLRFFGGLPDAAPSGLLPSASHLQHHRAVAVDAIGQGLHVGELLVGLEHAVCVPLPLPPVVYDDVLVPVGCQAPPCSRPRPSLSPPHASCRNLFSVQGYQRSGPVEIVRPHFPGPRPEIDLQDAMGITKARSSGFFAFLREAKRRKVYVSAAAYGGVSLVLIELTDAVAQALLFPDWTSRLVTFLLILGFPVVLVLSWVFDFTGKGIVRTSDRDESRNQVESRKTDSRFSEGVSPGSAASSRGRSPGGPRISMPALRRRRPVLADSREESNSEEVPAPDPDRVRKATLAHIRHELRTPVNGIIGYSEMLLEDVHDETFTADLEKIRAGGHKLLGLIDEVLGDRARGAGAGETDMNLEDYGEEIRVGLRTPVTSVVGYAEMLLETAREEGREELIADLQRIHTSAHRLLDLSGDIVGLATGGQAAPSVNDSQASELTRAVLSKIKPASGENLGDAEGRLLVVDDNAMNRDLLSRQLARQGYIVLTASDGAQALELLRNQAVDLILLDVIMPIMDGVETLKRLKSDENLLEIPVLMLSSLNEVDGALRCIEMGAEDYLSKPVKPAVLNARISANLELYRMRERERAYRERLAADEAFIESLLLSAFPEGVVERVRAGATDVADVAPEATVLACKVKGLATPLSSGAIKDQLMGFRPLCSTVESLAREHGVETCIWRSDGFLAVAGAPVPVEDHVERATALGRALLTESVKLQGADGKPLQMGLGLHTGPVVAAALGGERLRYEIWGEGVGTAEAVASSAANGSLVASPPVHARLKDRFAFEAQAVRDIGGVQMRTYRLRD